MSAMNPQPSARTRRSSPGRRSRASRALAGWLVFWIGIWSWTPAAAEEIGQVREVRSEVLAIEAGKTSRQLRKYDPLERGLRIRLTKRDSFLLAHFYGVKTPVSLEPRDQRIEKPGEYRIEGVIRLAGMNELEMGQENLLDRIVTTVVMEWGEFRAWLRPGRNHDIKGRTREASLGFKGTAVRVLADPRIGTFVGVDEGIATVQAFAGGDPVEVTSGQWVLVPPGGLPTRPAPLDSVDILEDPPLLLQDFTTGPLGPPNE